REVVINTQRRAPALVHEVFGHRTASIRGEVLQGGRVAGAGADDDGIVHRPLAAEDLDDAGRGRFLLRHGDVDADDPLALLVEDRVDRDRRLAGLAVTDDQLALAAADRG